MWHHHCLRHGLESDVSCAGGLVQEAGLETQESDRGNRQFRRPLLQVPRHSEHEILQTYECVLVARADRRHLFQH